MNNYFEEMVIIPESQEARRSFDKLVKNAEICFSTDGYRNTTIKDITTGAGLSVGSFYKYFKSKYQLYVYVLQKYAKELQGYLDTRGATYSDDPVELQTQYIMNFIRYAYNNPACYNLIYESLYINRDLFLDYYYTYAMRYVPALVKHKALPDGIDPLVWSYISMGIGNFIGLKVLTENDAGEENLKKIETSIRTLLSGGFTGPRS